jgi:organic radical activating enzyme
MTDLEFKQQFLDTKSESFCAAKWYNATIWLGSGQTTSCHHPPAHAIDIEKLKTNPRALHNTEQKKDDRLKMQIGVRPAGCEYCWKIEDMGRDAVSDRVYKSKIYSVESLKQAHYTDFTKDIDLKTLEISFDRTCQFACSYCNPAFSSTWVNDIKKHGAYTGLISDGRNHFTHTHDAAQLYTFNEPNPYVDAFFAWWESDLHRTLQELRITGGEPLMSGYTWKLIEWFKTNQGKSTTRLAINSNLGFDEEKLSEFIEAVRPLPHVELYTSMEATGAQAEYIRDGLDYDQWLGNVHTLIESGTVKAVHVMCTINALCLDSLVAHLDTMLELKQLYGRDAVNFTLNILRFPSFQSALVLPDHLRTRYRMELEQWLFTNQRNPFLHEHEINHTQRLIDYLDVVRTPHSDTFEHPALLNDFVKFYQQYDQRRGKDFARAFPNLNEWYESIQIQQQ